MSICGSFKSNQGNAGNSSSLIYSSKRWLINRKTNTERKNYPRGIMILPSWAFITPLCHQTTFMLDSLFMLLHRRDVNICIPIKSKIYWIWRGCLIMWVNVILLQTLSVNTSQSIYTLCFPARKLVNIYCRQLYLELYDRCYYIICMYRSWIFSAWAAQRKDGFHFQVNWGSKECCTQYNCAWSGINHLQRAISIRTTSGQTAKRLS